MIEKDAEFLAESDKLVADAVAQASEALDAAPDATPGLLTVRVNGTEGPVLSFEEAAKAHSCSTLRDKQGRLVRVLWWYP